MGETFTGHVLGMWHVARPTMIREQLSSNSWVFREEPHETAARLARRHSIERATRKQRKRLKRAVKRGDWAKVRSLTIEYQAAVLGHSDVLG